MKELEAERKTGYDNGYISACCLGKYKRPMDIYGNIKRNRNVLLLEVCK